MSPSNNDRRYTGDEVNIRYNLKRCIHAEFCVKHLSDVFDTNQRPWINADGASVEQVATVIEMCPSGALHYERKDGQQEAIPAKNVIIVRHDGPLEIRGDLEIRTSSEVIPEETRVSLCRCGASDNKPFCDNTHRKIAFEANEANPIAPSQDTSSTGNVIITAEANGPLDLKGRVEIINESGELLFIGQNVTLCRCGGSDNKPFCDGSHNRIQFKAD